LPISPFIRTPRLLNMTGNRRSSRRRYAVLEQVEPNYPEQHYDPKSSHEGGSTHNEEESNIKDLNAEVIGGIRRNANDDGLEYYYTTADIWVSGDEISPQMLSIWTKSQIPPPRRPVPDSEVKDVKRDPTNGLLMIHYREKGRNKADNPWPFQWVPVGTASFQTISAWAKVEKERVERSIRHLKEHQISVTITKRLHILGDLLDGETVDPVKPDWMTDRSSSDSSSSDVISSSTLSIAYAVQRQLRQHFTVTIKPHQSCRSVSSRQSLSKRHNAKRLPSPRLHRLPWRPSHPAPQPA
jgi:hypothetical protein